MSIFFDTTSDREHRTVTRREKIIEGLIGQLDGVVWSLVSIDRPQTKKWQHAEREADGLRLHRDRGQAAIALSERVQSIPAILTGYEPGLTPGSITVMDTRGRKYFESGNLAVGDDSRNRAREEELVREILDKLDWIKGVRVQVKVPTSVAVEPAAAPASRRQRRQDQRPVLNSEPGGRCRRWASIRVYRSSPSHCPGCPREAVPAWRMQRTQSTGRRAFQGPRKTTETRARPCSHLGSAQLLSQCGHPCRQSRADSRRAHAMAERTENQIRTAVGLDHAGVRIVEGGHLHDSRRGID